MCENEHMVHDGTRLRVITRQRSTIRALVHGFEIIVCSTSIKVWRCRICVPLALTYATSG